MLTSSPLRKARVFTMVLKAQCSHRLAYKDFILARTHVQVVFSGGYPTTVVIGRIRTILGLTDLERFSLLSSIVNWSAICEDDS